MFLLSILLHSIPTQPALGTSIYSAEMYVLVAAALAFVLILTGVQAARDEDRLTMRISGTNLPLKDVDTHFTLQEDKRATKVTVSPGYTLPYGVLGQLSKPRDRTERL